jgi:hypothetical protein
VVGGAGLSMALRGRPFTKKLARLGNGIAAAGLLLTGIGMVVVGVVQML